MFVRLLCIMVRDILTGRQNAEGQKHIMAEGKMYIALRAVMLLKDSHLFKPNTSP